MEQEQQGQETPKAHHRWLLLLLLIAVAAIAIFPLYTYLTSDRQPVSTVEPTELISPDIDNLAQAQDYLGDKPMPVMVDASVLPPIQDDEHVWGNREATVSIVMYGNLTGNYSRLMIPAMRSIADASNGEVNMIFRNYPLTENQLDYDAAELGECTYVQKEDAGYWAYVDALLALNPASVDDLLSAVAVAGADRTAATVCLENEDTWDYVVSQKQEAQLQAKLFVAPSFIVINRVTGDTRIVEGLNTQAYLQAVVDDVR